MFKRKPNRRRATLADCSACGANFVHPLEWGPLGEARWWMLLRCGQCGRTWEQTVADGEAELYDRALERAEAGMRRTADQLGREALEQQAEAFATALELDLIGAEDFAR
jgi:hypothetical protein